MCTKIINIDCMIGVSDDEILVEDNTSLKSVVGTYEDNFVTLCMANGDGKKSYMMTKKYARQLAEALMEKAK